MRYAIANIRLYLRMCKSLRGRTEEERIAESDGVVTSERVRLVKIFLKAKVNTPREAPIKVGPAKTPKTGLKYAIIWL